MPDHDNGAPADPVWWDAWRGVLFANARVLHAVERDLQEHAGLSLPFMDVLGRLYDAPGRRLRMQELQELSLFTRSGMTRLVDRIEAAALVRRERVPGDRRGVFVVLTSEGAAAYESALAPAPLRRGARVRQPPHARPARGRRRRAGAVLARVAGALRGGGEPQPGPRRIA